MNKFLLSRERQPGCTYSNKFEATGHDDGSLIIRIADYGVVGVAQFDMTLFERHEFARWLMESR